MELLPGGEESITRATALQFEQIGEQDRLAALAARGGQAQGSTRTLAVGTSAAAELAFAA